MFKPRWATGTASFRLLRSLHASYNVLPEMFKQNLFKQQKRTDVFKQICLNAGSPKYV